MIAHCNAAGRARWLVVTIVRHDNLGWPAGWAQAKLLKISVDAALSLCRTKIYNRWLVYSNTFSAPGAPSLQNRRQMPLNTFGNLLSTFSFLSELTVRIRTQNG